MTTMPDPTPERVGALLEWIHAVREAELAQDNLMDAAAADDIAQVMRSHERQRRELDHAVKFANKLAFRNGKSDAAILRQRAEIEALTALVRDIYLEGCPVDDSPSHDELVVLLEGDLLTRLRARLAATGESDAAE